MKSIRNEHKIHGLIRRAVDIRTAARSKQRAKEITIFVFCRPLRISIYTLIISLSRFLLYFSVASHSAPIFVTLFVVLETASRARHEHTHTQRPLEYLRVSALISNVNVFQTACLSLRLHSFWLPN